MKRTQITEIHKTKGFCLFAVFLFAGSLLRLWQLGNAPFPADEMEFYKLALQNKDILEFWKNPPWMNQIPLNETLTLLLVKVGLPVTPYVTRLPFAAMGILTLFFILRFAHRYFGVGAAIVALFFAVLNPYHLFFSRTAYHYAGAMCWSSAMLLAFWSIKERLNNGFCPSLKHFSIWFFAAAMACHMHISVWIVAAVQGMLLLALGLHRLRENKCERNRFAIYALVSFILLSGLMFRWVYRALNVAFSGVKQFGSSASDELFRLFPAYFAGENLLATVLLLAFAGIAGIAVWRSIKSQDSFFSFSWIAGLHVGLLMLYVGVAGGGVAKISYFSAIWPLFVWFLGIGLWQGLAFLSKGYKPLHYGALVLCLAAYTALTLPPAWAIVTLEGKPMPTFKINDWVMRNLPPGTPILVDHWLFPWNHLAIHNKDQINFTFTVPDDPVENYRALNWRGTAAAFFEKYPDAALIEVDRDKYIEKVGPWTFPSEHFARVASITNKQAMVMRHYGVIPTSEYAAANTNQVVTRIFYNTTEDVMASARRKGTSGLVMYGEGWRYLKPWQPMQGWPEQLMQLLWLQAGRIVSGEKPLDSLNALQSLPQQQAMQYLNKGRWADYRIPGAHSEWRLFNLSDQDLPVTLTVRAIALSGTVRCMIGDQLATFPQSLLSEYRLPLVLHPGEERRLVVAMPMNQFLLVHQVMLTP